MTEQDAKREYEKYKDKYFELKRQNNLRGELFGNEFIDNPLLPFNVFKNEIPRLLDANPGLKDYEVGTKFAVAEHQQYSDKQFEHFSKTLISDLENYLTFNDLSEHDMAKVKQLKAILRNHTTPEGLIKMDYLKNNSAFILRDLYFKLPGISSFISNS